MKIINLKLKSNPYSIYIGSNISSKINQCLKKLNLGNFSVILTNKKIYKLHGKSLKKMFKGIPNIVLTLPDSESTKSEKWLFKILSKIIEQDKLSRQLFITCFGGGVIGDLGGFAASVYKRGIPYVQIPTTFLAQIDSSIGGKTAIDFKNLKNIVGAFHQPRAVFIDCAFLRTLNTDNIRQGIAEAIKYGAIKSKNLFNFLENEQNKIKKLDLSALDFVVYECAKIKADIVTKDEKETKGIRTILNFGHTVGHAIESVMGFKLSHGEAVALGMIAALEVSSSLKICSRSEAEKIKNLINDYSLPKRLFFDKNKLTKALLHDKKFTGGKIRMVLLSRVGSVKVLSRVSPLVVKKSLSSISL